MKHLLIIFVVIFGIGCDNTLPVDHDTSLNYIREGCIEGHSYYVNSSGGIAINLDDNGKPIKCGSKAKK